MLISVDVCLQVFPVSEERLAYSDICSICLSKAINPVLTECNHGYCDKCLRTYLRSVCYGTVNVILDDWFKQKIISLKIEYVLCVDIRSTLNSFVPSHHFKRTTIIIILIMTTMTTTMTYQWNNFQPLRREPKQIQNQNNKDNQCCVEPFVNIISHTLHFFRRPGDVIN